MDGETRRLSIGMVTPHLPPEQAANALLPQLLCEALRGRGDEVRLMALYPQGQLERREDVTYIPRMGTGLPRRLRLSHMRLVATLARRARPFLRGLDVVHVHSNTFMNQVMASVARAQRIPFILTHYGTEIWHYRPRKLDMFAWMNGRASAVTYYSQLLMEHSIASGIEPENRQVVYPPVGKHFFFPEAEQKVQARRDLDVGEGPLLLNVKRLHPLAGQRHAIEAMPRILENHPKARFWIAGEGEERPALERLIRELGVASSVRLLGLVDHKELAKLYRAADLFLLPSRLEAFPTVAVEALASGLRVVSADHPGGTELKGLFPEDVDLVPMGEAASLAAAVTAALERREPVSGKARQRLESEFHPQAAVDAYRRLYLQAAGS